MNRGLFQIISAILVVLTSLVTACAAAPRLTIIPVSPTSRLLPAPTLTLVPPAPTLLPTSTLTLVPPSPTPVPALHPGWSAYTNANYVNDIAFDRDGNLWVAGSGGVVRWDPTEKTYVKYMVGDDLAGGPRRSIVVWHLWPSFPLRR
jgi:hypothetical protein